MLLRRTYFAIRRIHPHHPRRPPHPSNQPSVSQSVFMSFFTPSGDLTRPLTHSSPSPDSIERVGGLNTTPSGFSPFLSRSLTMGSQMRAREGASARLKSGREGGGLDSLDRSKCQKVERSKWRSSTTKDTDDLARWRTWRKGGRVCGKKTASGLSERDSRARRARADGGRN